MTEQVVLATRRDTLAGAWDNALQAYTRDELLQRWDAARASWLRSFASRHTRSSYATALRQWYEFIGVDPWLVWEPHRGAYRQDLVERSSPCRQPWEVSGHDVSEWIHSMSAGGKSSSTITQRVSAVSSFYSYVIRDVRLENGVERSILADGSGRPRANPFKSANVRRPTVRQFGRSYPIPLTLVSAMMRAINTQSMTGARNYALLETALRTGWRSSEVRRLRWQDISANPDYPGQYIVSWAGKGGKVSRDPFPKEAHDAIVAYLKLAGRWPVIHAGQYIWQRLQHGHRTGFNVDEPTEPYISGSQANAILRSCLRRGMVQLLGYDEDRARADARGYSFHNLRHTFANSYLRQHGDLFELSETLHHTSTNTTRIYAMSDGLRPVSPPKQLDLGY